MICDTTCAGTKTTLDANFLMKSPSDKLAGFEDGEVGISEVVVKEGTSKVVVVEEGILSVLLEMSALEFPAQH